MLYLLKSEGELGDAFWRGSVGLERAARLSLVVCACEEGLRCLRKTDSRC